MREEIAAGIKSAMERGYTLEQSAQTFINAGYNPQEVMAAGRMLASGVTAIAYPEKDITFEEKKTVEADSLPQLPKANELTEKTNGKKVWLIVAIILTLVVFLGALGYLVFKLNK